MNRLLASLLLKGLRWVPQAGLLTSALKKVRLFFPDRDQYLDFLQDYATRDHWFSRFFAAFEIHVPYTVQPEAVLNLLKDLSSDKNDMVLEAAAKSWSHVMSEDPEKIMEILEKLSNSDSYRVRRTAALAPVLFFDRGDYDNSLKRRIISFWKSFENDPKQGLQNLVRTQILKKRGLIESNDS
ncbi:MAG: hypothetical protein ABEJ65_09230 [bacterium]